MAAKLTRTNGSFALAGLAALFCASGVAAQEGRIVLVSPTAPAVAKRDAGALLAAARAALEKGDLDAAESLAAQAERIPRGLVAIIKSRWTDTPAKVRRDIQAARISMAQTLAETAPEEQKKDTVSPPTIVSKSSGWKADEHEKWPAFRSRDVAEPDESKRQPPAKVEAPRVAVKEPAPSLAAVQNKFLGTADPIVAGPFKRQPPSFPLETSRPPPPLSRSDSTSTDLKTKRVPSGDTAVALLRESGQAFVAGDFAGARHFALQARQLRPKSTWDQDDIARLVAYLRRPVPSREAPDPGPSPASTDRTAATVAYTPPPAPPIKETSSAQAIVGDEECEPVAQPERRSVPALAGGWCVVVGMGIGAALIMLFRQMLAGCQR